MGSKEKVILRKIPDYDPSKIEKIIGLTGTNGAGKGAVALFFENKGYAYFSLSDLIREELKKRGEELTRDNLIKMGNQLRESWGADILAQRIIKRVKGKAIIDSIRNPKEIEYLHSQRNFILLAIDAPVELRYGRITKRGRNESASTLEEFIKKEAEEMTNLDKSQQLQNCMKMADHIITNDGSLEELYRKLEKFS